MVRLALALALLISGDLLRSTPSAQVRPVYDRGAAGLTQLLQRLTTTASALHTGAHPDDEDSAFIARTARGDHARVAYLSLNRGEGGQNIIGPELFDALGVIRTEELLQARRLDGGEQFFTRAFDFGFSKTRDETAAKWDEQAVLEDMVRVIRAFRPLVIYSRFSGTTADGHGHHQMAGHLTPLAYRAAGDPAQFPAMAAEGLRPWQAKKLYAASGRGGGAATSLQLATGSMDPALGRSYAEIAAEGRSQHKSQQMGTIEPLGPASTSLRLIDPPGPSSQPEQSVFDGIDVSVTGLSRLVGLPEADLRTELSAMSSFAREALLSYRPLTPADILPVLTNGLRATRNARTKLRTLTAGAATLADADFLLAHKEEEFSQAILRAAGVVIDPLASSETVEGGGSLNVAVRVFVPPGASIRVATAAVRAPEKWRVMPSERAPDNAGPRRETPAYSTSFTVTVPADAAPTQPHFLARPRAGAMYTSPDAVTRVLPFAPPLLTASVTFDLDGIAVTAIEPVVYRYADSVRGELRRDVAVVPALSVGFDSSLVIVPTGSTPRRQQIQVHANSLRSAPTTGVLSLELPAGWSSTPASRPFTLRSAGDRATATFTITAPAGRATGRHEVRARATASDGAVYTHDLQLIAYPHIRTHRLYSPAVLRAQVLNLSVAPVRVGYIMGSGDDVPDAIRRMGVSVALLDEAALSGGDLSAFDTIVVGVRASETRPAFAANAARLRQFMERGGALVVQYQQQEYTTSNLPPYPAQMTGNSRVTDETAPVSVLQPSHAVFTFPNRITAADFDGWVQERNLYAFTSFDARYTPLLASADPGEMPQQGGELYARVGKGHYVYTAYAWFRQLPAGVPGAYRQFANLISLPRAPVPAGSPAPGTAPRTAAAPDAAPARTRPSR